MPLKGAYKLCNSKSNMYLYTASLSKLQFLEANKLIKSCQTNEIESQFNIEISRLETEGGYHVYSTKLFGIVVKTLI